MSFEPALQVDGALKTFGKQGSGFALPFRKRSNGQATSSGATNGHLDGKSKQTVAVNRVSFSVPRGEIFGVLGPNGSGKSTLIRLIATLLIPDGGQINVFGHDVVKDPMAAQRLLNRVSVEASFFKKLSPMENLLYGARLYGVGASTARAQAKSILLRLGLEEKAIFQPMEEMSRGMQQKVAIARAFLTHPILLLLDEPTTGLDPRSKREVQAFVRELRDTHDATILLTTHDMMEADILCDRIAIIDGGNIVALDTPANLKQRIPQTNGHVPSLEEVFLQLTGKKLVTEDQVA
ncbi:MAG: ABC transporter ATP-binding protein [Anaerolineae bacterium]|uniref:ABC transporter ATP-binding protein n=1 Tax=Candidatus Amarolinea dominans TaxID=3140696 RepID=UPI001DA30E8A|nr:ABC transporter ATP-binding protein [Anaerolineae bacterium]MBK9091551.1 ABC transporter ATP-binding protein [Anaerolineae bacterium]MBK9230347.1 ABC transporter ATP-binding protein [Anaerolineae bacterium]